MEGIVDSDGRILRLYEDVPEILDEIDHLGIPMALASRTEQPAWAQNLLELMEIRERFAYEEIYPFFQNETLLPHCYSERS
jgi:magnesium-dependent phosphatase 1